MDHVETVWRWAYQLREQKIHFIWDSYWQNQSFIWFISFAPYLSWSRSECTAPVSLPRHWVLSYLRPPSGCTTVFLGQGNYAGPLSATMLSLHHFRTMQSCWNFAVLFTHGRGHMLSCGSLVFDGLRPTLSQWLQQIQSTSSLEPTTVSLEISTMLLCPVRGGPYVALLTVATDRFRSLGISKKSYSSPEAAALASQFLLRWTWSWRPG